MGKQALFKDHLSNWADAWLADSVVIWPLRHMSQCYLAHQDPHIDLPAFFTAFKYVFLSLCLCFDCPLVILCLSASVSERVRIQGDGIVGWAQMSPRKVQQGTIQDR